MVLARMVRGAWGALSRAEPLSAEEQDRQARSLLQAMRLPEKVAQMSGDVPRIPGTLQMVLRYNGSPLPAGENRRLGIPGIRFSDGPRGVVMYHSTCFPVSMARGASWDVKLEERIGEAIGVEVRAQGGNFFAGVCINVLRHPAWGRAQETYGEDPYHLGEMGAALLRGVQRHAMGCIKHYVCNSIEDSRFTVDVAADERTLREVYLRQFRRCVEEGAAAVMSAYNKVNGEYCGHNRRILTDILKQEWGFAGFVISDFVFGIRDGEAAASAGLDVEMPFTRHYGRRLVRLVGSGRVPEAAVDAAVLRILRQKLRFSSVGEPDRYTRAAVAGPAHRKLAREAAVKSMVLLQNDGSLLPFSSHLVGTIAVFGTLATTANLGDHGSSRVRPPEVVTPFSGITSACGDRCRVVYESGKDLERARAAAAAADVAVVVVGYTHADEGEAMLGRGGDRGSLELSAHDELLIRLVGTTNRRTVVVVEAGSAVIMERWKKEVSAILFAFYPGMEGGNALADILFGSVSPSGKLPFAVPAVADHLPFFDPKAARIRYDRFHGYRLLDRQGVEPAFPFGFGLSYTRFAYGKPVVAAKSVEGETIDVTVPVTNTGTTAADEVVQAYVKRPEAVPDSPQKELVAFARVHLEPEETRQVPLCIRTRDLQWYAEEQGDWVLEPGSYRILVGPSSRTRDLVSVEVVVKREVQWRST